MSSTELLHAHVLLTGSSLPACCRPQLALNAPASSAPHSASQLLLTEVVRLNASSELSCLAWKCASTSSSSPSKQHTQWFRQRHVALVHPLASGAISSSRHGAFDAQFERDNPLVALWASDSASVGRFTLAKQRIPVGQRAFQAAAFAAVVGQRLATRRCHWCFAGLRKKALQCGACEFSRYCSRECLDADASLHALQCASLLKLRSDDVGDVETVRLALAVLAMEQFVQNATALASLVTRRRHDDGNETDDRKAVQLVVDTMDGQLDRRHVQRTLERVRSNAHPLYLDGVACVGSGVFPEAAMALNHSCRPNVTPSFDPRTRTLAFHAVVEIPRGYAVECAYIELFQSRKRRQTLLRTGFGFDCVCQRCSQEDTTQREATSDEEEEAQAMERLMRLVDAGGDDAMQQLARVTDEYKAVFQRSEEAQFALHTAEMRLAGVRGDWTRVIEAADTLLGLWRHCDLPESYPTTETLHQQIYWAAQQAGMSERAKVAAQRVAEIRRVCGYPHPDTPRALAQEGP